MERVVVGAFATNCYILENQGHVLVIDPGASGRKLVDIISGYSPKEVSVLLTHGHFDHIGAVDAIVKKFHSKVYACKDDQLILKDSSYNALGPFSGKVSCPIEWLEDSKINVGPFEIEVLYCPGHTAGSVMFIIEGKLFSGDTLFREGVGRTDLYSGSFNSLKQSLQVVYTLNADMEVYPGHDESTTIGHELQNNPYL